MSTDLHDNWGIKAYSLHDRPASLTSLSLREKHLLLLRLSKDYPVFGSASPNRTAFTQEEDGEVREVAGRPVLLISSTSWTADEDFSLLLAALANYDKSWTPVFPEMICAITGKGPLQAQYKRQIGLLGLKHVTIITCWLAPEDYPSLLSASDLGVSLHYSSSGLDLPMKVVDMFGAGIPVCARNFPSIKELVLHGKNGCVFDDSDHLARQLSQIFHKFGTPEHRHLKILGEGVTYFQKLPWHFLWRRVALPVFDTEHRLKDYGPEDEVEEVGPSGFPDFNSPGNMM